MPSYPRPDASEYAPYYATYLDKVPADVTDILKHLKKQGLVMLGLLRRMDDAAAEHRYAPDKWSVKEVVGHLIDTERLFGFRALWFARQDAQEQPGMDPDVWAAASNAHRRSLAALWREQHVVRTDQVYLFQSFDSAAVARAGIGSGNRMSVRAIPWIIAGHERHHMDILRDRYGLDC
jgi:hypothetical protein